MNRSLLLFLMASLVVSCTSSGSDDFDGDGTVDSADCAPADPSIHLGAPEICSDGIDNDCDSWVDCDDNDCLVLPECPQGDDDDSLGDDDDSLGDDDDSLGDDDDSSGDDDDSSGDDDDTAAGDDDDSAGDDDDSAGDDDDTAAGDDDDSAGDDDDSAGDDDSAAGDDDDSAGDDAGINMIALNGGTFDMGCTAMQSNCEGDESPVHSVTLTRSFWMGETEVTQGQWVSVLPSSPNPSGFSSCGSDCPVETVNWWESLAFANAMSAAEGLAECYSLSGCTSTPGYDMECTSVTITSTSGSVYDCTGYRLPTEAEWEYAARAGTNLLYAGSNTVGDVAWYESNSTDTTHAVATMQPNDWGLYDMSGNVLEWTWDRYGLSFYSSSPSADPEGPSSGSDRGLRGGSWNTIGVSTRVAWRHHYTPGIRHYGLGFRLARTIP